MSHSPLFKKMMRKKYEQDMVFYVYKNEFRRGLHQTVPLAVCDDSTEALEVAINMYFTELYGVYILNGDVLNILRKRDNTHEGLLKKYKVLTSESEYLFNKDGHRHFFEIKYRGIDKGSFAVDSLKRRTRHVKAKSIKEYIQFYKKIKLELKLEKSDSGSLVSFI